MHGSGPVKLLTRKGLKVDRFVELAGKDHAREMYGGRSKGAVGVILSLERGPLLVVSSHMQKGATGRALALKFIEKVGEVAFKSSGFTEMDQSRRFVVLAGDFNVGHVNADQLMSEVLSSFPGSKRVNLCSRKTGLNGAMTVQVGIDHVYTNLGTQCVHMGRPPCAPWCRKAVSEKVAGCSSDTLSDIEVVGASDHTWICTDLVSPDGDGLSLSWK